MTEAIPVSPEITFEQAIDLTQSLITQIQREEISEADLEARVTALVRSENGVRGFFVTYLTDERSIADHPSDAIIRGLQSSPEIVAEFLVKNLAMASAMAITHRRNQDEAMALGSERVQIRSIDLIQRTQLAETIRKARKLAESTATGAGEYQAFLDRWGYDSEQRQAIQQQMEQVVAGGT